MSVFDQLLKVKKQKKAGYLVLIDPDKQSIDDATTLAAHCQDYGVDALLVGGSLLFAHQFDVVIQAIKAECNLPIIIFPGGTRQISPYADAILFLSVISGRNPNHLIGEQVIAAPLLKSMKLEPISTGYMFIESGNITSAQFLSDSSPIPREKADIAVAHALAAEYIGMKMCYLEAGSGAKCPVPEKMIAAVSKHTRIPLIVGGGIRSPEEACAKVQAGAGFIVTGNVLEKSPDVGLIKAFADAIHQKQ